MKKFRYFFKRNNSGSALVIVVGMLSIFIILVTTSLSIASATQRQTSMEYNRSQAYYCASSALDVFYDKYNDKKDTTFKSKIDGITSDTTIMNKNISGMGDIQIVAKKDPVSGNTIITANAKYANTTSKASLVLDGSGNIVVPTFNGVLSLSSPNVNGSFVTQGDFVAQDVTSKTNIPSYSTINGRIYIDGELDLNSFVKVNGYSGNEFYIQATKNITINNDVQIIPLKQASKAYINCNGQISINSNVIIGSSDKTVDIYTNGIQVTNNSILYSNIYSYKNTVPNFGNYISCKQINGDVYIKGDLTIAGSTQIDGNVIVTGTLIMESGVKVSKNIYCGKLDAERTMATISKFYSPTVITGNGALTYEPKRSWNEATDRAKLALPVKPALLDPVVVFEPFKKPVSDYVTPHFAEMQTVLNPNVNGISGSGTIADQNNHTINVNDKAIWIRITSSQIGNILIKHNSLYPDTPVFFYVATPGGNFNITSGQKIVTSTTSDMINGGKTFIIDNYNDPTTTSITKGQPVYWLLNEGVKMNINDATVEGYFYGPKADLTAQINDASKVSTEKYSLNGTDSNSTKAVVIGAIIVNKASISNTAGTIYLKPRYNGIPTN